MHGLFNSVYSNEIEVTIRASCVNSLVNGDVGLKEILLSVPSGLSHEVITLKGPTDSDSVAYGNGYDICGER